MSQNEAQATEAAYRDEASTQVGGQGAERRPSRGRISLREMFGAAEAPDFDSYEALDAHIRRTETSTRIRMIGIPAGAVILVVGLNLVGAQQVAIALTFPLLFIAGVFMMTANINRYHLRRLKRLRENWAD